MINIFTALQSFFKHVLFDEIQSIGKDILLGAAKAGTEKGITVIKSLPLGLGLNDEEAYFAAERYAKDHLGVTMVQIDKFHSNLRLLTSSQRNEIRLLVSRRCQEIDIPGPHGERQKTLINPDGANLLKDLVLCPDTEHFMELLERAGADKNLIDTVKSGYQNILNSPFVQNHKQKINQVDQSLNNWFAKNTKGA